MANRGRLLLPLLLLVACGLVDATGPAADVDVREFVELLNAHRADAGCVPLSWDDGIAAVAQAHSEDMVARGFFDHTNPDGATPFDRLADAGIVYRSAAENIAAGQATGERVLASWLSSSGHRANIENCSLTQHGVGLFDRHWTHVFIRP